MADPIVFPVAANAVEPLTEGHAYLTDILTSANGTEQRIRLRQHPVGRVSFAILAVGREAQLVNALIHGHQPDQWAVPLWQYAGHLAAAAAPLDVAITVNDDDVPFGDPSALAPWWVLLWQDYEHYELLAATSVDSLGTTSIALATPVVGTWPAATTLVMPVRLGRLSQSVELAWESPDVLTGRLEFSLEAAAAYANALPDPPVVDTLAIVASRDDAIEDGFSRRFSLLGGKLGARESWSWQAAPALSRAFSWKCFSRAEAIAMRTWLDARMGRAIPFWLPSPEHELTLAADAAAIDSAIDVEAVGYTAHLYALGGSRRYVRLRNAAGATIDRHVAGSVDNLDGTETLTLDSALGAAVSKATWSVGFRRFCRLDQDEVSIDWIGTDYAEAVLKFVEVPGEATP